MPTISPGKTPYCIIGYTDRGFVAGYDYGELKWWWEGDVGPREAAGKYSPEMLFLFVRKDDKLIDEFDIPIPSSSFPPYRIKRIKFTDHYIVTPDGKYTFRGEWIGEGWAVQDSIRKVEE